jgi:hypothetical protein
MPIMERMLPTLSAGMAPSSSAKPSKQRFNTSTYKHQTNVKMEICIAKKASNKFNLLKLHFSLNILLLQFVVYFLIK